MKARVLVTRPRETADEIAALLHQKGFEPVINPLLEIIPTGNTVPDSLYDAIFMTSAAAVRAYAAQRNGNRTPLYTVGQQTRQVAIDCGFPQAQCLGETVAEAAEVLRNQGMTASARLLYPCGRHISHDLSGLLGPEGPEIIPVPLYDTKFLPLEKKTIRLLCAGQIAWILVFSRRTAEALAAALHGIERQGWIEATSLACLSVRASEPALRFPWVRIAYAEQPTADSLLACLSS